MLRTKPITKLFERAQAVVARRSRRDGARASEELRPVFDHIAERFYDVDLTLDDMVRKGVVNRQLRVSFREQMGVGIKAYLLRLKAELAKWLLWKTHLQVRRRLTAAREQICSRLGVALPPMREQGPAAIASGTRIVYLPEPSILATSMVLYY